MQNVSSAVRAARPAARHADRKQSVGEAHRLGLFTTPENLPLAAEPLDVTP
jgi:hypothetical protein